MLRVIGLLVTAVIVASCAAQPGPPGPPPPPPPLPQINVPLPPPPLPPPASFDGPRPGPSMRYAAPKPYKARCTIKKRKVPVTSVTGRQYYRVTNYKVCR